MKWITPQVKRTLLIVVEGENDYGFLTHLKKLYLNTSTTRLKTVIGYGGSATHLINKTIRESRDKAFDTKLVLLDADFKDLPTAKARAKKNKITIITSEPCCLECLLLDLLEQKPKQIKKCDDCKSALKKLLNRKDNSCLTQQEFGRYFPKEILDGKRPTIGMLDQLIGLMET